MVKKEFVEAIAAKTGASKKDTAAFVDALGEVLMNVIAAEDKVKIGEVVTIGGRTVPGRDMHSALTGKDYHVAEKKGYPYAKFSRAAKACD